MVTASDDNTVKVWDLRKKTHVQIIAAHNKLISDVKFVKPSVSAMIQNDEGDDISLNGGVMLTSSYDKKVKMWAYGGNMITNEQTPPLVRTLDGGHENKITSVCATNDLKYILSTSFDRTFKLWK